MNCPTCEIPVEQVSRNHDILQCPECRMFYDPEGKMLCGACYTYTSNPDGWCNSCRNQDYGNPELTDPPDWMSREDVGRLVRDTWIAYCLEIGDTKASHIAPWEELSEQDKEADRRIGDAVIAAYRKYDESMWMNRG